MFRIFPLVFVMATITGCSEHETGQVSQGGNSIGPATTEAVNDRAVELPSVRNTMETAPQQAN